MTIEIFDDVFAEHDAQIIHDMITNDNFLWHYYHKSENGTDVYHWHRLAGHNEKELIENDFDWVMPMWNHILFKYELDTKYGINTFRRIYFNAHTYGIEPLPHRDDGDFTMIYYPDMKWRKDWGGGTVVGGELVPYVGNRLIVFDATTPHQAMPVSRQCYELRSVIVFKTYIEGGNIERLDFYKD